MSSSSAETPVTEILVIRHGQSTWNAVGRWQGQADPPLTAVGETQALHAATVLASGILPTDRPLRAIVTSDLQRAAITASIIADELGFDPVAMDKRLRERHAGAWQGLTRTEVEERYPGYLVTGQRPDDFESAHVAGERAGSFLIGLGHHLRGGTALVVSHGGILRALRIRCGLDDDFAFANLSGQWFHVQGAGIAAGDVVELVSTDRPISTTPL
jgi:probable phosphoglycerate mutase